MGKTRSSAGDSDENHDQVALKEIEQFYNAPVIDDYIRLRLKYPHLKFHFISSDGIEFLFSEEKLLRENNLDPMIYGGAFEADGRAQSMLSLALLKQLIDRDGRLAKGEAQIVSRKKAISNSLVNYLIANMLDSLYDSDASIEHDLVVLIKYQLGTLNSEYSLENKREVKKREASLIAAHLAAEGQEPSYRKIAAKMGVQPSTVMRWFPDNSMISEAKALFGELKKLKLKHLRRKARR